MSFEKGIEKNVYDYLIHLIRVLNFYEAHYNWLIENKGIMSTEKIPCRIADLLPVDMSKQHSERLRDRDLLTSLMKECILMLKWSVQGRELSTSTYRNNILLSYSEINEYNNKIRGYCYKRLADLDLLGGNRTNTLHDDLKKIIDDYYKREENSSIKNKELYEGEIRMLNNQLSNAHSLIKRKKKRIEFLESTLPKTDLQNIIDSQPNCRKKNGKLNYKKIGEALGVSNKTAKNYCEKYNLD